MLRYLSRWTLCVFLLGLFCGCTESLAQSSSRSQVTTAALTKTSITGVWQGRSIADCPMITTTNPGRCLAMQLITLTMFQDGDRVTGSYRCAFGNEECRDLAETGVIRDGHMTAKVLRIAIMLDDGSMCRFTGMPHNDVLEGRYQCHWGGPMELGGFHLERSY